MILRSYKDGEGISPSERVYSGNLESVCDFTLTSGHRFFPGFRDAHLTSLCVDPEQSPSDFGSCTKPADEGA